MTAESGPPFATLVDYVEGRLDPERANVVAAEVSAAGPRALGAVRWLEGFLACATSLPLEEPPRIVRQRLRQHFDSWSRARAMMGQAPHEIFADLLFDSREDLVLAGTRYADASDELVHLAFTSEQADLVLDIAAQVNGTFRVDGQVLLGDPGDAPTFEAELTNAATVRRDVEGDAHGRFSLSSVRGGHQHLRVGNGKLTIVVEFELPEARR